MQIILRNFRSWKKATFEFNEGELILLKGESGSGKTTVVQAVFWVLHGKAEENVHPKGAKKSARTRVTLELPTLGMTITRYTNPGLLKVKRTIKEGQEEEVEDDEAQDQIDSLFGTHVQLITSVFTSAQEKGILLFGKNNEKLTFLNRLAFGGVDIEKWKTDLANEIKETNEKIKTIEYSIQELRDIKEGQGKVPKGAPLDKDERSAIKESLVEYEAEATTLEEQVKQYYIEQGRLNLLQEQLKEVEKQITQENPEEVQERLTELEQRIQRDEVYYRQAADNLKHRQQLGSRMAKLIEEGAVESEVVEQDEESLLLMFKKSNEKITQLTKHLTEQRTKQEIANKINRDLTKLQKQLSELGDSAQWSDLKGRNIAQELKELDLQHQRNKKIHQLTEQLAKYPELPTLSQAEFDILEKETLLYSEYQRAVDKLGTDQLTPELSRLSQALILHPKWETWTKRVAELEKILSGEEVASGDLKKDRLQELTQKVSFESGRLEGLKAGLEVHCCPACSANLRWVNSKLVPSDVPPATKKLIKQTEEELKTLINKRDALQELLNLQENQINYQPGKEKSLAEIKEKHKLISQLKDLSPTVPKMSLEEGKKLLANTELQTQRAKLLRQLTNLGSSTSLTDQEYEKRKSSLTLALEQMKKLETHTSLTEQIKTLTRQLPEVEDLTKIKQSLVVQQTLAEQINRQIKSLEYQKIKQQHDSIVVQPVEKAELLRLKKERTSLQEQLQLFKQQGTLIEQIQEISLDDQPIQELERIKGQINKLNKKLERDLLIRKAQKIQEKIDLKDEELNEAREDLKALHQIKEWSSESETRKLQQIVDAINTELKGVVDNMYKKQMSVELSLFKPLKSKKTLKQEVNLRINYDGEDYKFEELSSGERARLTLALHIALSRLSHFPFLVSDEAFNPLDSNLRESCLGILRDNMDQKGGIITCHDIVEGHFDTVVDVEE